MPDYIIEPIATDFEDIVQEGIDYIQTFFPDWEPGDAQLDYVILRFCALKVATTADMASRVMRAIYVYFGTSMINIQAVETIQAQVPTTWTANDTAGHTIEAGTACGLADGFGDLHLFDVDIDVVIPIGQTQAVGVIMTSQDGGVADNGLSGSMELTEASEWVTSVVTDAPASGGADPETTEEYINRLSANLGLMAPRPILARDFALIARNVPGVWRAIALDNYIPPSNFAAENAVGVAAIDQSGIAINSSLKTELDIYLQSLRQQNFIVNVVDPTNNEVDITYVGVANTRADPVDVKTRADAALRQYLDPRYWGVPTWPPDLRGWERQTSIRVQELYTVLNNVEGFDYASTLTFAIDNGTNNGSDKSLTGTFPLPFIGTITGTVT